MTERDIRYGINIQIPSGGAGIYVIGQTFEETMNILLRFSNMYDDTKWETMQILRTAQKCNASLAEIKSSYQRSKLNIYFEFEIWEDFLNFKEMIEKNSLY